MNQTFTVSHLDDVNKSWNNRFNHQLLYNHNFFIWKSKYSYIYVHNLMFAPRALPMLTATITTVTIMLNYIMQVSGMVQYV
jgi:hypothetical protein